jgi:ERCC4-type nuclease
MSGRGEKNLHVLRSSSKAEMAQKYKRCAEGREEKRTSELKEKRGKKKEERERLLAWHLVSSHNIEYHCVAQGLLKLSTGAPLPLFCLFSTTSLA